MLIITGYPSIPNAAAAMRLGACDYVTKPFTAEEVTWAVQRVLSTQEMLHGASEHSEKDGEALAAAMTNTETLFWEESWVQLAVDGSASVGAILPGLRGVSITGIRLPRIGEVVYQGLPMAGLLLAGKPMMTIPAPVSGVVAGVNELLAGKPQLLATNPCGDGWIACLCTTRHEEMAHCKPRSILLVNTDDSSAESQCQKLSALGCQVERVLNRDAMFESLSKCCDRAIFLDADSLGNEGPALVERINRQAPLARMVVLGSAGGAQEAAYRKHKIFYYAVEPFADNEIADILMGVFSTREIQPAKSERTKGSSEPISSISITNRNMHKVHLLAAPGLLWGNEGLGQQIGQKLLMQMLPVVVTPGETQVTPANILKAAGACDRVMVLLARDSGILPGGLVRDTKPDFDIEPGEAAGKVAMLSVQPDNLGGFACLDARTIAALAEHIVWDMASY